MAAAGLIAASVMSAVAGTQASADDKITNPIAVFSGLDKITGRITTFDVYIDETVQFGALQLTPRACYTRPDTEAPKTDTFVEVDEITLDRKIRRIFSGWMFADSPGLNAVEHPVYDVWLKSCKQTSDVPAPDKG
ncbi:glycosyl hydrolase family 5 [Phyllobacterium zundukense]|nr:glycosyl hydrolase family 5 [Phyllobacterium zundukense]